MARTNKSTGVKVYYEALQKTFGIAAEVMTAVLPHKGERGRSDEERLRAFLAKVLPRRYSVGTGFIICSDATVSASAQTDLVIFDEWHNSPLHREFAADIYPVETVYAAVEVKGVLRSRDLKKCLADISRIRNLAEYSRYAVEKSVPVPGEPGKAFAAKQEVSFTLPPRTFVFAYDAVGWSNLAAFASSWKQALAASGSAHLHGVAVVSKG